MTYAHAETLKAAIRMMVTGHQWGICLADADCQEAEQIGLKTLAETHSFACAYDDARKCALRLSSKPRVVAFDRRRKH